MKRTAQIGLVRPGVLRSFVRTWALLGFAVLGAAPLAGCRERPPRARASAFALPARPRPTNLIRPAFPLAVAPSGRYLVDQKGVPFRLQSDAAWLMSTRATAAEVDGYLADRSARGFNAFVLMGLVHQNAQSWKQGREPANANGDEPFTRRESFATPNEPYFAFLDSIIDKAAAHGMAVLFFYTYLGYEGGPDGWWSAINAPANTKEVCFRWGQYLGRRYKDRSNIIWMVAGDYDIPADPATPSREGRTRVRRMLEGIRSAGARQLASSEWGAPDSLITRQEGFSYGPDPATSDMQLNLFYGHGPGFSGHVYLTADRAWRSSPVLPAAMFEPVYENSTYSKTPLRDRASMRKYAHWSVIAGGTAGHFFGTEGIWNFLEEKWHQSLDSQGSRDQSRAFAFYAAIPWWEMRPSGTDPGYAGRNLIAAGGGSGDQFIAASATGNGSHLIAYVPPTGTAPRTFSVDLRGMAGKARARWWSPATGLYSDARGAGHTLANTVEAQPFTTPGDNGSGANDWLLVLDAAPEPLRAERKAASRPDERKSTPPRRDR